MRIGINLVPLNPTKIGGMEQYFRNIFAYFLEQDRHEYYLFVSYHNEASLQFADRKVKRVFIREYPGLTEITQKVYALHLDLWFCPFLVLEPCFLRIPSVVTIPDIQHEYFPEYFPKQVLDWRRKAFGFSAQKADAVLTLSEYSKSTIVERYGINPEKVFPIHLDAGLEFSSNQEPQRQYLVKTKRSLPERYAFYPANTWPHKNHLTLFKALQRLKKKGMTLPLVMTGSVSDGSDPVIREIKKLGLAEQVQYLGYVDNSEMPCIFQNAAFLVFPSKFEGFGIPLVEAMKTGCPIICANSASIPEVAGEAALFFDPDDDQKLAALMEELLHDDDLKKQLIAKGLARAQLFSWERTAKDTLAVLEKAAERQTQADLMQADLIPAELIPANHAPAERLPLISVITPSLNQGKFIRETIESVLNQNYRNIEYIVVDGGSADETVEILQSYGERITWLSEPDEGQADAVNKGIKLAKGEIIGWLNSDDTYCPGALSKAAEFLSMHPELDVVYGEGQHITETGDIIDRYPTEQFNYERLAETCFICQPSAFIRRRVFDHVQLDKDLHLCMDYAFWIETGQCFNYAYIPELFASSRLYPGNKTLSRRKEVYQEVFKTVKKFYGYLPFCWIQGYVNFRLGKISHASGRRLFTYIFSTLFLIGYNAAKPGYVFGEIKRVLKEKSAVPLSPPVGDQYADGWIGPCLTKQFYISAQTSQLRIRGKHLWPDEEVLEVAVFAGERRISEFTVRDKGNFRRVITLHPGECGLYEIKLVPNNTFIPARLGINSDTRELSFILDSIEVVSEGVSN